LHLPVNAAVREKRGVGVFLSTLETGQPNSGAIKAVFRLMKWY
jgi:hypothetical protein